MLLAPNWAFDSIGLLLAAAAELKLLVCVCVFELSIESFDQTTRFVRVVASKRTRAP